MEVNFNYKSLCLDSHTLFLTYCTGSRRRIKVTSPKPNSSTRTLGKLVMLWEIREHNLRITLVGHKDVTSWSHRRSPLKGSQRSNEGATRKNLVAERAAGLAGVAEDFPRGRILEQVIVAFENLEVLEDSQLHRSTCLLATHAAVAPNSERGFAHNLSFKGTAHALPGSCRHVDGLRRLI